MFGVCSEANLKVNNQCVSGLVDSQELRLYGLNTSYPLAFP